MLRVFLAGEGPTDIGGLANHPAYREAREGFFQPLLRRMLAQQPIEFVGAKLTSLPKEPRKEPRDALSRLASQAMALAALDGAQLVVFVRDVDRDQGTARSPTEAKKRVKQLRDAINAGLAEGSLPGVAATPCRMVEAWALGDVKALEACGGDTSLLPKGKTPEALWGDKHDPDSNHPKAVLRRVMEAASSDDLFAELGALVSPTALELSCPLSFAPFAQQLEAIDLSPQMLA